MITPVFFGTPKNYQRFRVTEMSSTWPELLHIDASS